MSTLSTGIQLPKIGRGLRSSLGTRRSTPKNELKAITPLSSGRKRGRRSLSSERENDSSYSNKRSTKEGDDVIRQLQELESKVSQGDKSIRALKKQKINMKVNVTELEVQISKLQDSYKVEIKEKEKVQEINKAYRQKLEQLGIDAVTFQQVDATSSLEEKRSKMTERLTSMTQEWNQRKLAALKKIEDIQANYTNTNAAQEEEAAQEDSIEVENVVETPPPVDNNTSENDNNKDTKVETESSEAPKREESSEEACTTVEEEEEMPVTETETKTMDKTALTVFVTEVPEVAAPTEEALGDAVEQKAEEGEVVETKQETEQEWVGGETLFAF